MCPLQYYGIEYEINPHMKLENKSDHFKAIKQWDSLFDELGKLDVRIEVIKPEKGWPDMCFAANGAVTLNKRAIIAKFKHPERQGESQFYEKWFVDNGYEIIGLPNYCVFEGAGDALWAGKKMYVGYGQRSNVLSSNRLLYEFIGHGDKHQCNTGCSVLNDVIPVELVDPYFYHLDTCFCPIDDKLALIYEPAFGFNSLVAIKQNLDLISVPDEEAMKFACNAVVVGKHVIMPSGCEWTERQLKERGYTPHPLDMSEFIKAGGACKCLTLSI